MMGTIMEVACIGAIGEYGFGEGDEDFGKGDDWTLETGA